MYRPGAMLTAVESCPASDGACAMVLGSESVADRATKPVAWVRGSAMRSEPTMSADRDPEPDIRRTPPGTRRHLRTWVGQVAGRIDEVERIGIARSWAEIEAADALLFQPATGSGPWPAVLVYTDLAGLRGARFVLVTEVEAGRTWAESRIKAVTGGDTARPGTSLLIVDEPIKPGTVLMTRSALSARFSGLRAIYFYVVSKSGRPGAQSS